MSEARKKKYDIVDSFFGGYGLRYLKSKVRKGLPKLKQAQPEFYLQMCDLFQRGDPLDREAFELLVRTGVELLDGLIDSMPFVPEGVKDQVGDWGGDLVTEVRDHFSHTKVTFPDQMEKIKGKEMVEGAWQKLRVFLADLLQRAVKAWRDLFDFRVHFGQGSKVRHLGSVMRTGSDAVDFLHNLYNGLTTDKERREYRQRILPLLDEPEELAAFALLETDEERKEFIAYGMAINVFDVPEWLYASFGWSQEQVDAILLAAATTLEADNKKFNSWSRRDLKRLEAQRYSLPELRKHPKRAKKLAADDPRRLAFESEQDRRRDVRLLILTSVAAATAAFFFVYNVVLALIQNGGKH